MSKITKTPPKKPLMGDFMLLWLEEQPYLKQSTAALYRRLLTKHLIPAFGAIKIADFGAPPVREFIKFQLTSGRLDRAGGLSPKTVHEQLVLLNSIVNAAVQRGMLAKNPIPDVRPPQQVQRQMRVFSPEEQRKIEETVSQMGERYWGIVFCLYTGLRLGELCALKWENVDFSQSTIEVRHTMQRVECGGGKTRVILDSAKSARSLRTLPLSPGVSARLLAHYKGTPENLRAPSDFVFCRDARPIEPRLFEKYFQAVITASGIEPANFHALRHTFATRCIEFNMDAKSLSELLGHSKVSMTMDRYVHSLMAQKRLGVQRLDAILVG